MGEKAASGAASQAGRKVEPEQRSEVARKLREARRTTLTASRPCEAMR
jgi:hypothetical protein